MATVIGMASTIAHRGPDDSGVWVDGEAGIALGHRRLSVLDLSAAGHQPMVSVSGRYILVFNGEIYNHLDLRTELERVQWRGHSDTETILAAIECWGLDETLKKSVGMFALALWDRNDRVLSLARDRMGEKPLYYGWQGESFLFGSELKALKCHPAFLAETDRNVLPLYLRYGYIPSPYSIYYGIRKLIPGSMVQIKKEHQAGDYPDPEPYWSLHCAVGQGFAHPFKGSDQEAAVELETRITTAISLQRQADVPLGAFLSGGIDSSAVVSLMQWQVSRPVKTFTIGFHEQDYNEAGYANAIARHLGTDHTELYVTPQQAMGVIPHLPMLYDEPFGDSSQIPTLLISQMTRQHVTVALSGDGGDELFGGYPRYFRSARIWRQMQRIPPALRRSLARGIHLFSPGDLNLLLKMMLLLRGRRLPIPPEERLYSIAEELKCTEPFGFYRQMITQWRSPARIMGESVEPSNVFMGTTNLPQKRPFEEQMMFYDALGYLPDDVLVKVDRAAMSVNLETRLPLLDHRVVEFAWRLPFSMKIRNGEGKWLLRQMLYKHVPKELIERPKMGFGVPVDRWLRGPLRDWAEDLLSEDRLRREDIFNPEPIRERWRQHVTAQYNWRDSIWLVLMFQAWQNEKPFINRLR